MKLQGIVFILAYALTTAFSTLAGKRYLFHLPWVCSVYLHKERRLFGACAILNQNHVLVSPNNIIETVKMMENPETFSKVIQSLVVYAGTNFMSPLGRTPAWPALPGTYQKQNAAELFVAVKASNDPTGWDFKVNPEDLTEKNGFEQDAFGLAFGVGILRLQGAFAYTDYVRPIIINGATRSDVKSRYEKFLQERETEFRPRHTCVTYSWNKKLNRIIYHEVVYVKGDTCRDAYCYWDLKMCDQFPRKPYLGCFRSVKYTDVCPSARGAALYCPTFDNAVFAILTTAPSCGQNHLSGVYTIVPPIVELFEKISNTTFVTGANNYKLEQLQQTNLDYEGVA